MVLGRSWSIMVVIIGSDAEGNLFTKFIYFLLLLYILYIRIA